MRMRAGGVIPWFATQQFQESRFGKMSSMRGVRIGCHPDYANVSWLELGSWIGY